MIIKLPEKIGDVLDLMEGARQAVFKHCGYQEQWRVFPLDDQRGMHWRVEAGDRGEIRWAETPEDLDDDESPKLYAGDVYTQRHHQKWVYRGAELTLAIVNTHCDLNVLLIVFETALERKETER